jgi:hypothetical protein
MSAYLKHLHSRIGSHFQHNANREVVYHCTTTLPVIFGWTEQ